MNKKWHNKRARGGSNFAMTLIMKFFVLCGLHYLTIEKIL